MRSGRLIGLDAKSEVRGEGVIGAGDYRLLGILRYVSTQGETRKSKNLHELHAYVHPPRRNLSLHPRHYFAERLFKQRRFTYITDTPKINALQAPVAMEALDSAGQDLVVPAPAREGRYALPMLMVRCWRCAGCGRRARQPPIHSMISR